MTPEQKQVIAKNNLQSAIHAYYEATDPDAYIDDWCLVVHKDSISMTHDGMSAVGYLVPDDQPFHRTVGMLELASYSVLDSTEDSNE